MVRATHLIWWGLLAAALPMGRGAMAQHHGDDDPFLGTWQAKTKEGVRTVIIRPDSSASYGEETVRWRLQEDVILLALGGEWVDYRVKIRGKKMTLSGGDLTEPITLVRIGPPTPRPAAVPVPPDPDRPVPPKPKAKGN